ncbi:hypothetical protein PMIN01_12110 [Paraphaeosphaeria minitans]|uniref:Uncharacterized protein n=1 Tax=Paraphaeosphaeria minitans TaxID=565426 RepID=A0A9P6KKT3_9PLEO|nr:hypothetical protein PMIN01_12110 [Paraphaeosphaeria minitans]
MPGGRPKKYITAEAKAEAKRRHNHEEYLRRKDRPFQRETRPEFVHYEPIPLGIPTTTRIDLGLRISTDVPIPCDSLIGPDELPEGEDVYRPPSPLASLAADDVEAAAVISQLQTSDREQTNERIEYERRIQQQIKDKDARTAGILLEMQAGTMAVRSSADNIPEHSGNIERPIELDSDSVDTTAGQIQAIENSNLQRSSTAPIIEELATTEEPPVANTHSVSDTLAPTPAKTTSTSSKALNSPQTPSQRSVSSARSTGRRKTFPAQSNTLLSWVKPVSRQPSENSNTLQLAQASLSHSTPPPLPPSSNRSTPRLPQPSNSNSTPQAAARGTPAAGSPSPGPP